MAHWILVDLDLTMENNGMSYYVWLVWLPTFILKHLKFNYYATVWADTLSWCNGDKIDYIFHYKGYFKKLKFVIQQETSVSNAGVNPGFVGTETYATSGVRPVWEKKKKLQI